MGFASGGLSGLIWLYQINSSYSIYTSYPHCEAKAGVETERVKYSVSPYGESATLHADERMRHQYFQYYLYSDENG